jgi:hypothetical protein
MNLNKNKDVFDFYVPYISPLFVKELDDTNDVQSLDDTNEDNKKIIIEIVDKENTSAKIIMNREQLMDNCLLIKNSLETNPDETTMTIKGDVNTYKNALKIISTNIINLDQFNSLEILKIIDVFIYLGSSFINEYKLKYDSLTVNDEMLPYYIEIVERFKDKKLSMMIYRRVIEYLDKNLRKKLCRIQM